MTATNILSTIDLDHAAEAAVALVQRTLSNLKLYLGAIDGAAGPQTKEALDKYKALARTSDFKALVGDGTWPWTATVDSDDIVLTHVLATAFGGAHDTMDSGRTASGFNTYGHPSLIACSLPMRDDAKYSLRGSPIPRMPFGLHPNGQDNPAGAHVNVTFLESGKTVENVPVIDLGPARDTNHAIDLTVALAREHDPRATANDFLSRVSVRILGAAKYASKTA